MEILLASPRGYCAGVDRAIDVVRIALELYGPPVYVRHEIVHNRHVVDSLRERGAVFVDEISAVPEGSVVVFSAHGVAPTIRSEARERKLRAIDATCPLVTKVHLEALRFAKAGYQIVLIGHAGHAEVEGTMGEAPDAMILVQTLEDVERLEVRDPARLAYLTQTTLSVDETAAILDALKQKFPAIRGPAREDICYATTNRQAAVRELAAACDLVLVVGSPTSSNSNRLREVAEKCGAESHLVESVADVREEWLTGKRAVGVTAGASTPEHLVQELVEWLRTRGGSEARDLVAVPEEMFFHLPSDLAKDLESSGRAPDVLAESGRTLRNR
ncbi:MAG: 4-hydroxy-3-methylbut-2-enyl diphosphate reductase [Candidatus Eiseniibacteriota bacterium]